MPPAVPKRHCARHADEWSRLSLSVVIPAFNEERRLGSTLVDDLPATWPRSRGRGKFASSTMGRPTTPWRLRSGLAAGEPRVVVQREPHRGKGGAVKAGLLGGARRSSGSSVTPTCRCRSTKSRGSCRRWPIAFDVAIGSREGRRLAESASRSTATSWDACSTAACSGWCCPGIEDSQCGFKMFTADAVRSIFPRVTVDGWAFDVEVLAVARAQQLARDRGADRVALPRGVAPQHDARRVGDAQGTAAHQAARAARNLPPTLNVRAASTFVELQERRRPGSWSDAHAVGLRPANVQFQDLAGGYCPLHPSRIELAGAGCASSASIESAHRPSCRSS